MALASQCIAILMAQGKLNASYSVIVLKNADHIRRSILNTHPALVEELLYLIEQYDLELIEKALIVLEAVAYDDQTIHLLMNERTCSALNGLKLTTIKGIKRPANAILALIEKIGGECLAICVDVTYMFVQQETKCTPSLESWIKILGIECSHNGIQHPHTKLPISGQPLLRINLTCG